MSTTTTTISSTSTPRLRKMNKPSKIITLRVSPAKLSKFAPKSASRKNSKLKAAPSTASTPALADIPAPPATNNNSNSSENASESNATPIPPTTDSPPVEMPKKRGPGAKSGTKRAAGLTTDGTPKPRGKPGPKKKPRLEDGTIDHSAGGAPGIIAPTHKLGPKANQGAINAGLRALDRTGKPCRKWDRRPFQLKSFTGIMWDLPSWRAPPKRIVNGADESKDNVEAAESGSKANESSTALESEKSNAGEGPDPVEGVALSTPAASSPAPIPAAIDA
ncbi:MAG: hypothetical protein Q9160_005029 [Pyrenula sp. 1 TL-2023]